MVELVESNTTVPKGVIDWDVKQTAAKGIYSHPLGFVIINTIGIDDYSRTRYYIELQFIYNKRKYERSFYLINRNVSIAAKKFIEDVVKGLITNNTQELGEKIK